MFDYNGTEKFDVGKGYGKVEYGFYNINGEDDFWALMNHYGAIFKHFNYFLDRHETTENNTDLSLIAIEKMKKYKSNICLTFLEEEFMEEKIRVRKLIVNELKPDNIYNLHIFYFFHFINYNIKDAFDHHKQGLAYAKTNFHNAAIMCFSNSIKYFPSKAFPYHDRGLSYFERKNYDKAIKDFTQAIKLDSNDSFLFSIRGLAYKKSGNIGKAKIDFDKALKLDPKDIIANECLEKIIKE